MGGKLQTALLYNGKRASLSEREAAFKGLLRFSRIGELGEPDSIDVSRCKASSVRLGERISELSSSTIQSAAVSTLVFGSPSVPEAFSGLFRERKIIGIGLSTSEFLDAEELSRGFQPDAPPYFLGFGLKGLGGMVSLNKFRNLDDEAMAMRALELLVIHELGHSAGRLEHCANQDCLMHENDPRDRIGNLIENFVNKNLDFCKGCLSKIRNAVANTRHPHF
jgi:hypothetical protein